MACHALYTHWNTADYTVAPGRRVIRGRAFSGEGRAARVQYAVDDGPWQDAELGEPNISAV